MSLSSFVIIVLSVVVVIFGIFFALQSSEITDVFDDIPLPFGSDLNVVIEPESSIVGTVFAIRADLPKKETQDFTMRIDSEEGSDFVVLYDDGEHFDFEAGDGIYKGFFDSSGKSLGEYEVFSDSQESVGEFKLYEPGCELVRGNPSEDKINFVILPSGYDNYGDFKKDAEDILSGSDSLMEIEPFKSNSGEFSFSLVNSSQDLGCQIGCRGIDSIVCCDDKKVLQEASQCHYDNIFILVNDDKLCGSASAYAKVCAGNSLSNLALVHELGHSFADLADEYIYADQYGDYDIGSINNLNCAEEGCEKWADITSG